LIGAWIEDLAWPEVGARFAARWPVLVPIGARSKEHGHHLPMATDYLVARAFCDGIIATLPVLVAPVIDFGYYPAFIRYPGSQHLRAEIFVGLLRDVLERLIAQGAGPLAILNTGVSTEGPVQIATRDIMNAHGVDVAVADIRRIGRHAVTLGQRLGGHGDEHETSLMLAIAPERVDMSKAKQDYGNMLSQPANVFISPSEFRDDPAAAQHHSATGVRGDPTLATAEKGRAILAAAIAELVEGLRPLCPVLPA
jgi:creatinine amidohydrolase